MMQVELWGLNEVVEIDESLIEEYKTDDVYCEEAYQLDDGRWIAYDDAISEWVMLG